MILGGPTGAGKTDIALALSERIPCEIVSMDSRQVYLGMDVGTAKPSRAVRCAVRHHLIDVASPDHTFSAAEFADRAEEAIAGIRGRERLPLLVGGSGLYIQATVDGLFDGPAANPIVRNRLRAEAASRGSEALHQRLRAVDAEAARGIHPRDTVRVIRALEVYEISGHPVSTLRQQKREVRSNVVFYGVRWPRPELYRRINRRVDEMIEQGLVNEVRRLVAQGYTDELPSFQAVGYRQLVRYLQGAYHLNEAIRLIKRDTRRLAKRQLNWFRRDGRVIWWDLEQYDSVQAVADAMANDVRRRFPDVARLRTQKRVR